MNTKIKSVILCLFFLCFIISTANTFFFYKKEFNEPNSLENNEKSRKDHLKVSALWADLNLTNANDVNNTSHFHHDSIVIKGRLYSPIPPPSGTPQPNYNVSLVIDGSTWNNYNDTTDVNGEFEILFNIPESLKGGINHTIEAKVLDTTPGDVRLLNHYVIQILSYPNITIISPYLNQTIGQSAPNYTVLIDGWNIDTLWYSIDGSNINITFTNNGTINQTLWNNRPNGNITLTFYANNTIGNLSFTEVIIKKDTMLPNITIISPAPGQLFGVTAPDFIVKINDTNLHKMWYSLDGIINITFTTNSTFNQTEWNKLPNGTIMITFHSNDTTGNLRSLNITIRRDVIPPKITILKPRPNNEYDEDPPTYQIIVEEGNLHQAWYSIDGGKTNITLNITLIGSIGIINTSAWEEMPIGKITIRFYANDTMGNINWTEVIIWKDKMDEIEIEYKPWSQIIIIFIIIEYAVFISLIVIYYIRSKRKIRTGI